MILPQNGIAVFGSRYHTRPMLNGIVMISEKAILLSTACTCSWKEPTSCGTYEICGETDKFDQPLKFGSLIFFVLYLNFISASEGLYTMGLGVKVNLSFKIPLMGSICLSNESSSPGVSIFLISKLNF